MAETLSIGAYDVTILVDGIYSAPIDHLTHAGGPERRAALLAEWPAKTFEVDVNCFLAARDGAYTLIDAGAGNAWGDAYGKLPAALAGLEIAPNDIGRVLITHLHGDHALGLLDGDAPWLAEAEIYIPGPDWRFFTDAAEMERLPPARRGGAAIAARLAAAYGDHIRLYEPGDLIDGIEAIHLPGHTPGQCGFVLAGDTTALMIVADALHLAALQAQDPEIGVIYDIAPDIALKTRRDLLARCADSSSIIAGGHLPGFGRVERAGDGFSIRRLSDRDM